MTNTEIIHHLRKDGETMTQCQARLRKEANEKSEAPKTEEKKRRGRKPKED